MRVRPDNAAGVSVRHRDKVPLDHRQHTPLAMGCSGTTSVRRVVAGATGRGLALDQVVTEVGSGMDGHRRKLTKVLSDPGATVLVVEHRDRLTRFGFEHLAASLAACGRRIVVLDEAQTTDDLVREVTEVLTSLCVRRSGLCVRRSGRGWGARRAAKAVAVAVGRMPA